MFHVVHEVPGRLRLRSRRLHRNPAAAEALTARLRAMEGVVAVEASPRTGSLLIRHDAAPGRAEALRAAFAAAPPTVTPSLPPLDTVMERLTEMLLEHLAERLLGAVAAALI
jgi:hypothetical protein